MAVKPPLVCLQILLCGDDDIFRPGDGSLSASNVPINAINTAQGARHKHAPTLKQARRRPLGIQQERVVAPNQELGGQWSRMPAALRY
jgi:hypothetical protein